MFNEAYNHQLSMFDVVHLLTLLSLGFIFLVIYLLRHHLSKPKHDKIFRITLGLILLIFESGFHLWTFTNGGYSYHMIPLTGFCAMTNVLTIYALLCNKTKLFNYLIYYAITGALFALIFVDTSYGIPHFRYFHYFIVHYGFLLASLYYFITKRVEIKRKHFLKASLMLFIYTLLVLMADLLLKENWFYLFESPVKEISDFFGYPLYTILWLLAIFILISLWYGVLKIMSKFQR